MDGAKKSLEKRKYQNILPQMMKNSSQLMILVLANILKLSRFIKLAKYDKELF